MTTTVTSCLSKVEAKYSDRALPINPSAFSEAIANDDGESIKFSGFGNNNQDNAQKEKWAKESKDLAWWSIGFHIVNFPLKLISYFISKNSDPENWFSKGFHVVDSLTDTLAGMFRNKIYNRQNDNLGAVEKLQDEFGDTKTHSFTKLNLNTQIYGRFLIPVLSLISPNLANDIDSAVIGALDSSWFRTMSLNSGFYPGIIQDSLTKWFGKKKKSGESKLPTWRFVTSQLREHWEKAKAELTSYKNADTKEKDLKQLTFCKYMDQVTSIIVPFICLPSNLLGDIVRPILRRLNITGLFRNIVRVLSVADRSLIGINYWFRFYKPDQIAEKNLGITNLLKPSNLYFVSLIGDIADLPITIFEDKIKESSNWTQHSVEVMRIVKNSAFNTYWAWRRARAAKTVEKSITPKN